MKANTEKLDELVTELEQGKYRGQEPPQEQKQSQHNDPSRTVDSPTMPADDPPPERKAQDIEEAKSVGEKFVESDVYTRFTSGRWPAGVPTEMFEARSPLVKTERKATPVIGDDVIEPGRDSRFVRNPQMSRLTLRDIMDVRSINSNTADYVTIDGGDLAADIVDTGGLKPEAGITLAAASTPVRTIAVTTPIDEVTLQDVSQIQRIIDDELTYQVRLVEERQMLWADGTGLNLSGLIPHGDVPAIDRGADQLLDRILAGQTDVRLAGFEPNAVIIHPLDWEAIALLKDADNGYIYSDPHLDAANLRLWGMNVVITTAAEEVAGNTTEARSLIVGDFRRGATLYDRQTLAIQFGWVNDQFRRNQRTIRAEERIAFAVRSPLAFAKYETEAAVA